MFGQKHSDRPNGHFTSHLDGDPPIIIRQPNTCCFGVIFLFKGHVGFYFFGSYTQLDTFSAQMDFSPNNFNFGEVRAGYRVQGHNQFIIILKWETTNLQQPAEKTKGGRV